MRERESEMRIHVIYIIHVYADRFNLFIIIIIIIIIYIGDKTKNSKISFGLEKSTL